MSEQVIDLVSRQSERHGTDRATVTRPWPPFSVSLVIPAKNEARNIGWVLERVPASVSEILLVDGESTDGTPEIARAAHRAVRVVEQGRPGKGAALRAGFRAARGDVIVMLDADGSMSPHEIDRYLYFLAAGYDLVRGSRFVGGGGSVDFTPVRRWGNRLLTGVVNVLYGTGFSDLCYGYCAFHRRHLDALALESDGFEIETEILINAVRAGLRVAEVPSMELARRHGESNLRTFRDGERVLRTALTGRPAGRRTAAPPIRPIALAGHSAALTDRS